MINLLKETTIEEYFPDLQHATYVDTLQGQAEMELWTNIQNLCMLVPSVLAKIGDYKQALKVIKDAEALLVNKNSCKDTYAIILLMGTSLKLHQQMIAN